jgi:hypothetical protein
MLKEELRADDFALINRLYDVEMIEKLAQFRTTGKYNCDITISCALNIASATEDREVEVFSETEYEDSDNDNFGGYVMINNNIIAR